MHLLRRPFASVSPQGFIIMHFCELEAAITVALLGLIVYIVDAEGLILFAVYYIAKSV